jgi:hypothetical protein
MQRIRTHLSFANVVACLALFIALGGAGYAATKLPRNSVGTAQIKKNAVTTAKLKAKAVTAAKIRPGAVGATQLGAGVVGPAQLGTGAVGAAQLGAGAVGTRALADGAVTGAKVDAGSLGTVPDAAHAASADDTTLFQGRPPSKFVQGEGQVLGNTVQLALGEKGVPVLDLPGLGALTAACETGGKGKPVGNFNFTNASGTSLSSTLQYPEGSDGGILPAGKSSAVGGYEVVAAWTWTFSTLTAPIRIATLNLGFDGNATPSACVLTAQALVSG